MRTVSKIRFLLGVFMAGLVFAGITAFPIEAELRLASELLNSVDGNTHLSRWITLAYKGIQETNAKYPFISYGTDWLAFAHIVIAIAFIGPYRDPVRNVWVIEFGIIACALVIPVAVIAGAVREIPWFWRVFDCLFGVVGGAILILCRKSVKKLAS